MIEEINERCLAQGPTPRPRWDRSSSYSSHDRLYHLQQVGNKPRVQEGTQLDLPVINQNKVTPRIMQGFISGASLTTFCIKGH